MRTITLEVQISEEVAELWETMPAEERNHYAVAASTAAADVLNTTIEGTNERAVRRSGLMRFAGIGKGSLGALTEGVAALRDEWDERGPDTLTMSNSAQ